MCVCGGGGGGARVMTNSSVFPNVGRYALDK